MPEVKKAGDILVCSKCGDRVLVLAAEEAGLKKCPLCEGESNWK